MENKQKTKKLSKVAKATLCAVSGLTLAAGAVPTVATIVKNNNEFITVYYSAQNGQSGEFKVNKQTLVSDLKITPQEGYEFKGWYKDEACTQKYLATDVVTANSTIYAKLELLTYAVIFPSSDFFTLTQGSSIVKYGDSISFKINKSTAVAGLSETVKVNGVAVTPDSNGVYTVSNITSNVFVTIDGLEVEEVAFNVDGTVSKSIVIEAGDTLQDVIDRAELSVTDYNSCGWFTDSTLTTVADLTSEVKDSTTLYTKTATTDKLTFSNNKFTVSDSSATEIVVPVKYNNGTSDYTITNGSITSAVEHLTIPTGYTQIATNAFRDMGNLQSINLHSKITYISYQAFMNCSNLDVDFTKMTSLIEVYNLAFYNSGITKFVTPENFRQFFSGAFSNCSKLTRIEITHDVSFDSIHVTGFFTDCPNLEYIYWNGNLPSYYSNNDYFGYAMFDNSCTNVENPKFIVGKDVTNFSFFSMCEENNCGSDAAVANIKTLIFEQDEEEREVTLDDTTVIGNIVIFDSQKMFDAYNGKLIVYNKSEQMSEITVYVKADLTNANSFVAMSEYEFIDGFIANSQISSYYSLIEGSYTFSTSTATLVTDGEYAGYYMYKVTPTAVS